MYTNIADNELVQYHHKILSNVSYSLTEILDSNPLFKVVAHGDVYKIIPLFYCERIESSNNEDKVLDTNKGVICTYAEDTIIRFITNTQFRDFNLVTNTVTKFSKNIFYGVAYDEDNSTPLKNVEVSIEVVKNNNVVSNASYSTNENGEFVHFITVSYDKINVTAKYENITHTYEVT